MSAVLYSRLTGLTSGEAFSIVQMHEGHGVEGWRLLNRRFDPKTDSRLTTLILSLFTFKVKSKDILAGLAQWESKILILERDYKDCALQPKMKRALLMHILPEGMKARVMEHLDRLDTYQKVREKIVALAVQAADGEEAALNKLEEEEDQRHAGADLG